MIISIDFDDTIVYSEYPHIGSLLPNAKEVLNYLWNRGHTIIINSCRVGQYEANMKGFLDYNEIKYDWINRNCPRVIKKYGTDTRKISCDLHIDDKNLYILRDMIINGSDVVLSYLWNNIDFSMTMLERPLVIAIIGESGSGKSMVGEYLAYEYGINLVQSYTDRERRSNNETGHTFLSPKQMDKVLEGDTLAYTKFGDNRYCCIADDLHKANCYVIDEDGIKMLEEDWGEELDIFTIRIKRDDDKRLASVGKDRIDRDKGRYSLPDSYYDYVIHNVTDDKNIVYADVDDFMKKYRLKDRVDAYEPIIQEQYNED